MNEDKVEFEFLWLPYPDDIPDVQCCLDLTVEEILRVCGPLKRLKSYVNKTFGSSVFIQSVKSKIGFDVKENDKKKDKNENSLFYNEFFFSINCSIQLKRDIRSNYESLVNLFCFSQCNKSCQELWLKFDYSHIFESKLLTRDELISLRSFAFGNLCGLNTFVERFSGTYSLNQHEHKITQVKVKFLHDYHRIELYFVVGRDVPLKKRSSKSHCLHKLEIPYSALHTILLCKTKQELTVYFKLLFPPLLYAVYQNDDDEEEDDIVRDYISYQDLGVQTSWLRTIDLFKNSPEGLRREFSMNSVLKLEFDSNDPSPVMQIMYHYKNVQIYFSPMSVKSLPKQEFKVPIDNFGCYYAVQCFLTLSFEFENQLQVREEIESFQKFFKEEKNKNPNILCEALYLVYGAVSQGVTVWIKHSIKHLFEKFCKKNLKTSIDEYSEKNNILPRNIVLIKRGIFTPTHLRLLPPNPQLKSRALRCCDPDFFLRISIRDVNLKQINFTLTQGSFKNKSNICTIFFESLFKAPLLLGIKIGERCYRYVGSSTSQLKAHGLWFYAKDKNGMTASALKSKLGDINQIHTVAKYMARKGQTFSQAMGNIRVPQEFTNVSCPEEDVKGGVKKYLSLEDDYRPKKYMMEIFNYDPEDEAAEPYVFSDGIGRLSPQIAEEVYKALDVEDLRPSAMQIRYAGCKGMLVVDPRLTEKKIIFRESMKKFSSTDDSLEILKFSEKRCAFLNRPFITILEQLGVEKEKFVLLQKKMLQHLVQSMYYNEDAFELLNRNSLARFNFVSMSTAGIHFTEDPMFKNMIYSLIQNQLVLLKDKANIELPVNEARSMFGVLDETFSLEYGQVFVQYRDWDSNEKKILKGTVVVTKNPCMHPGDVRKFEAIDVESLHHISDCLVFPAKGPRPHPDEMAGSDLDGDEYHVIWMKDLIFSSENEEAMHFAIKKEEKEERTQPIMAADELDHLFNYILNDNVGLIGSAHLAFADSEQNGIFSDVCMRLAKHYAIALDFAKSGENVQHRDIVHKYPDFMQKIGEKSQTYLSTRALGVLYRNCRHLQIGLLTENFDCEYRIDSDLVHVSWENYKKSALKSLKKYSSKVEYLMRTYNFESEGQLLAGAIINPPAVYEQRHDLDNMKALLEYEVQWIFREFERQFFNEFGGKPERETYSDAMHQKASAWYMVTYEKVSEMSCKYFGMPWSVADVLIDLKHKSIVHKKPQHISNSKSVLVETIDKSLKIPLMTFETDVRTIFRDRIETVDIALMVLKKWFESQSGHLYDADKRQLRKYMADELDKVASQLISCSDKFIEQLKQNGNLVQAISPGYYVIETLLRISKTPITSDDYQSLNKHYMGLLAWQSLIKLACTYKPKYVGIVSDEQERGNVALHSPQDDIIDTIQLLLFDDKDADNQNFSYELVQNEEKIIAYLIEQTKLKRISYRSQKLRDNHYHAKFTLEGTRFAIEKCKDIVVSKKFFQHASQYKPFH